MSLGQSCGPSAPENPQRPAGGAAEAAVVEGAREGEAADCEGGEQELLGLEAEEGIVVSWSLNNDAAARGNGGATCASAEGAEWAEGVAGEDRMQVVASGNGYVFSAVYDGFTDTSAADFLVANLHSRFAQQLVARGLDFGEANSNASSVPAEGAAQKEAEAKDTSRRHEMVLQALAAALSETEAAYFESLEERMAEQLELAVAGACLVVAVVAGRELYVMNLGDCRAVVVAEDGQAGQAGQAGEEGEMGEEAEAEGRKKLAELRATQLTEDHNTSNEKEVERLRRERADDPDVITKMRVKGKLKTTRAFGAAYLKNPRVNAMLLGMLRVQYVGSQPYLSSSPHLHHLTLSPSHRYLVLSSDGLYQHMTPADAAASVSRALAAVDKASGAGSTSAEGGCGSPCKGACGPNLSHALVQEALDRAARRAAGFNDRFTALHSSQPLPALGPFRSESGSAAAHMPGYSHGLAPGVTSGVSSGLTYTGMLEGGPSALDPGGRGFSALSEFDAEVAAAGGKQQGGSMMQAMQAAMGEDPQPSLGDSNQFPWSSLGHRAGGYGASALDYSSRLSAMGMGLGSGGTRATMMQGLESLNYQQLSGRAQGQGITGADDFPGMVGASSGGLSHRLAMDEGRMLMGQAEAGMEGIGSGTGLAGFLQYHHHSLDPSPLPRTPSGQVIMPSSHVSMSDRAYLQQPASTSFQSLLAAPEERGLPGWPDRALGFDAGPSFGGGGGGGGGGASSAGMTDAMLWSASLHRDLQAAGRLGGAARMGSGGATAAGVQAQQQHEGGLEQQQRQGEPGVGGAGGDGKTVEAESGALDAGADGAEGGDAGGVGGATQGGVEGGEGKGSGGASEGEGGDGGLQRSSRLPPWARKQLQQSGRALGGDPFRVSSPRLASSPHLSSQFSSPLSSPHLPSPLFSPGQPSPFSSPCFSHLPSPRLAEFQRLSISIPPSPPPFGAHSPLGAYTPMGAPSLSSRTPGSFPFPTHSPLSGAFPSASLNTPSVAKLSPSVAASNRSKRRLALRAHHSGAHIPGRGRHTGGRGGGLGGSLGSPRGSGRMGQQRMRVQGTSGGLNVGGEGMGGTGHGQGAVGVAGQQMSPGQVMVHGNVSGSSSGGGVIGGSRLRPQASLTESEGREVRALCLEPLTRRGSLTRSEGEGSGGSGGSRGTALAMPRRIASMEVTGDVAGPADVDGGADVDSKSGGSAGSTPKQLQGVSNQDLSPSTGTGFRGYGSKSKTIGVLFEKLLTASDTSHLGRVVLPKVPAERFLPHVESKEGILIIFEDSIGGQWCFRYRFWPNNRSRMYVLEHAGDYIRKYGLTAGDTVSFLRSEFGHLMLKEQKAPPAVLAAPPTVASPSILAAPTTPAPVLALSTHPVPLSAVPITPCIAPPVTVPITPSRAPLSALPTMSSVTQDVLPQFPPPPTSSFGFLQHRPDLRPQPHSLPSPQSLLLSHSLPLTRSIDRFQGSIMQGGEQIESVPPTQDPLQVDPHLPSPHSHTPRPLRLLSVPSLPRTPTLPPDTDGPDSAQKCVGEAGGGVSGAQGQAKKAAEAGAAEASVSGAAKLDLKEGFEGSWQTAAAMALLPGDRGYEEPTRGFGQPSSGFEDPSCSYHVPSGRIVQDQENCIVGQLQYYGDLVGGMVRGDEKGMERGGRAMEEEGFAAMGAGLGETEADRPAHMGNHLDALMEDAETEAALGEKILVLS
ncbi:unnamed protein product [Closterium sp. Naga37s-1]|nr:unnamed protein product [Closterium sp. Naga37s-1]